MKGTGTLIGDSRGLTCFQQEIICSVQVRRTYPHHPHKTLQVGNPDFSPTTRNVESKSLLVINDQICGI